MKPITLSAYKITPRHIMQLIAVMALPASIFLFETVDRFRLEGSLYDLKSVNAVIVPSILGACLLKFAGNEPIARTFLAIGVPIGLISSYFDVVVVVSSMDGSDFNFLGYASGIMLLAVAYGALISALGYAFNTGISSVIEPIKKRYLILFSLIVILSFVNNIQTIVSSLSLESSFVYPLFFDPIVFKLYLTFIFSFLALGRGREHFTVVIGNAALFTSVVIIIFALYFWFRSGTYSDPQGESLRAIIVFSSLGVMYGAFIYLMSYIVSLGCVIEHRINVKRMNWHLAEVNAFLFFLAFAPASFSDYAEERQSSDERAILIESLIDRIEELERTL
ncbi:hypothetical protein N9J28_00855 [bacterium]|nr:hypothetical protein [bacterium]